MTRLTKSVVLFLGALAVGLIVAGCSSGVISSIKSLAPSKTISVPTLSPGASPTPVPTAQPSVAPPTAQPSVPQTTTAPALQPSSSPTSSPAPGSTPAWLWWLIGAVVVIGVIVLVLVLRSAARRRSAAAGGWRSRVVDAYAKGSALYDAMSFAERPGALAAEDSGARWADIQRRADDLGQTLYALREAAPDEDERARVVDALGSLQAVRSAMAVERAPGGADAGQAEVVRGRLFGFDAALRALRPPDPPPR